MNTDRRAFLKGMAGSAVLCTGALPAAGDFRVESHAIWPANTPRPDGFVALDVTAPYKLDFTIWDEDGWKADTCRNFQCLSDGSLAIEVNLTHEQGFSNDTYHDTRRVMNLRSADGGITWHSYSGRLLESKAVRLRDGTHLQVYPGGAVTLDEKRRAVDGAGGNPDSVREGGYDLWPESKRAELAAAGYHLTESLPGLVATMTALTCARSNGEGMAWDRQRIEGLPHLAYVYGSFRCAVELRDGTILAACNARRTAGGPRFAFVLRSEDQGVSWSFHPVFEDADGWLEFTEMELLQRADGRVLALVRSFTRDSTKGTVLHQSYSDDHGATWTPFKATPMWGHPPQLIQLREGAILCTYAHRRHPYGSRACLSHDGGDTWDYENEIVLCDSSLPGLVDYPTSIQLQDDSLLTLHNVFKVPRIPYREDDQLDSTMDLLVHRREKRGNQRYGGLHVALMVSRFSKDFIRAPGQTTSRTKWPTGGPGSPPK